MSSIRARSAGWTIRVGAVLAALAAALPAPAQEGGAPVPERRVVVAPDTDFPGGDLRQIFDTTYQACRAICLGDPACAGFTYNARSGACFPKGTVGAAVPYQGATSGRIVATPPAVLARAAGVRAELDFLSTFDFDEARAQAAGMSDAFQSNGFSPAQLVDWARAAETRGDWASAVIGWGALLSLEDEGWQWLEFARATRRQADAAQSDRFRLERAALSASLNAALRAADPGTRAAALALLATALERDGRGREMIPALRLSLAAREDAAVRAELERAVALHGFRVIEHQVTSDSAQPRICAVFSEDLDTGADYAPFVQALASGLAVEAEGRQLCLSGVQHGQTYDVTFRAGLPSAEGEALGQPVTLSLYVRDRAGAVRFPGRSYVLPAGGPLAIPVETVNADRIALALRRVSDRNLVEIIAREQFARPLDAWEDETFAATGAETLWTGEAEVAVELNRAVTTRLPLADMAGRLPPGVYMLSAALPGADPWATPGATQWFVVSDLGLATLQGVDGLHVVVRSLETAAPREGVTVALVSRGNAVLATAETDPQGLASFAPELARGTGPMAPALVTAEVAGADLSFLSLTDPAFDLSDRGVEGREAPGAIDVFLAMDRGAYRAGEVVNLTALARDADARAVADLPLTARLMRPDGVEYSRIASPGADAGGHVFHLPLGPEAPRGAWRVEVLADPDAPALASRGFVVEDFLPERVDLTLRLPEGLLAAGALPTLELEARWLYGAPAADLPVSGQVALRPVAEVPDLPGWRMGRHDADPTPRREFFGGLRTDAEGAARVDLPLPPADGATGPQELTVLAEVSDSGNRPVERRLVRLVGPDGPVAAIRPQFDGAVPEGTEAVFDLGLFGADLRPVAAGALRWRVLRLETNYQWYAVEGRWFWQPVTTRTPVAEGEAAPGSRIAVPVGWGRYELRLEAAGAAGASIAFDAGWYAPAGVAEAPDMLEVGLDRAAYRPGETASLRIVAREAGVAVVSVLSNRLIDLQAVELPQGESTLSLPVTDDWGAGAYVAVSLLRPMQAEEGRNPARALGLAHAAVDPGDRALAVSLDAPAASDPRAPLEAVLLVEGVAPGTQVWATVAAVDQGILNLTGFTAPDPSGHYFGQRRLGVALRDLYGRLIDGMTGTMGAVRSGGDAGLPGRQAPPPTEQLVAFFQGPLMVGPDGTLPLRFDMPAFNGTVRLMAVVWSDRAVGQAEAEVLVRDPVVVTASLPRFLAPGDSSRLRLDLAHAAGPAGEMALSVTASPGVTLGAPPATVTLAEGGRAVLDLPLSALAEGAQEIRVALTTPDGRVLDRVLALGVASNDPEVARTSRLMLDPGATLTFDGDLFAGLRPGTGTATLAAGPLSRLNLPALMRQLDRYPYGCAEQVTSVALPFLYLGHLEADLGMTGPGDREARIRDAIRTVLTFQAPTGSFGLWYAGSGDLWLDAYVTDFLTRARAAGHAVPDRALQSALANLRNRMNYAPDFTEGGAPYAYALHVLAREGAAAVGDLRYYADQRAAAFDTPLAAAHLGAALAAYGDPVRADRLFAQGLRLAQGGAEDRGWRDDYGTTTRDLAGLLTLAAAAGSQAVPSGPLAAELAAAVADRVARGGLSTQEAVWTLLAAEALSAAQAEAGLSVNGRPVSGPVVRMLGDLAGAAPVSITNTGAQPAEITLSTFGVPVVPEPAGGTTLRITRSYYTLDGEETSPDGVPVGTRLVAVLRVQDFDTGGGRLMVEDPLPAGFEIDTPSLLRAGDVRSLEWLDLTDTAEFTEARQDRFLASVDRRAGEDFTLAYIVRAVSPGTFHHPAASVHDMYRPTARALGETGRVSVTQ